MPELFRARRYLPTVVALVAFATFLPALRNGFVDFDDDKNFLLNPSYRGLGWAQLQWMFSSAHMGHYIPLTWITLGLDYRLWGMNPAGYHFTSVILHAITAALFYCVAYRLIGAATRQTSAGSIAAGALVAALFFAVHPLRVESVAWVTERRDVVSGAFYLATLVAWFRAVERERSSRRWYWASLVLFACALLSKVIAVSLPAVLILLDVYPLRRLGGEHGWWTSRARAVYAEKIPFLVLAGAASALAFAVVATTVQNMPSYSDLGIAPRLAISAFGLAFYLWKTLLPTSLSPLYELKIPVVPTSWTYLLAGGVVLVLSALAVSLRHRARWLGTAWIAYVVMLLPVLGLVQNGPQVAADRYTYLACLPWTLVVGGAVATGLPRAARTSRNASLGLGIAALVVTLQALTVVQIRVWHDSLTLWQHAVRVDPSSGIAYNNLGGALFRLGRTDEAIAALRSAVARLSTSPPRMRARVSFDLARLLYAQGDLAAAEQQYRETLSLDPGHASAWNDLGVILATRGQLEAAFNAFRASIALSPDTPGACENARRVAVILHRTPSELVQCRAAAQT